MLGNMFSGVSIKPKQNIPRPALMVAILVAAVFFFAAPDGADASKYPAKMFLFPDYSHLSRTEDFTTFSSPFKLASAHEAFGTMERIEFYIYELSLWEAWQDWEAFQRGLHKFMPLLAVRAIIQESLVGYTGKLQIGPQDTFLTLVRQYRRTLGRITFSTRDKLLYDKRKRFDPFGWLLEDEGIFSGEEWSWDNFLPRVAQIAGLLIVGLLITEILRYFMVLGLKGKRGAP